MFYSRFALFACVLFSASVAAAVQFESSSGVGFVPGSVVQESFGWTDGQFQLRAPGVSFRLRSTGRFTGSCSWRDPQGAVVEESRSQGFASEAPLSSGLHYQSRQRASVDGFQLMGFLPAPGGAEMVPAAGSICAGPAGQTGTWMTVTLQVQSRTLLVRFGGAEMMLPF